MRIGLTLAALLFVTVSVAEEASLPNVGVKFLNFSQRTVTAIRFHSITNSTERPLRAKIPVMHGSDAYLRIPNLTGCEYHIDFIFDDGSTSEVFHHYNICTAKRLRLQPAAPTYLTKIV